MNQELMDEVIKGKLEEIKEMDPDDDTYTAAVNAVVALQKARNEARKVENEQLLGLEKLEQDNKIELKRLEQEKWAKEHDVSEAKKERWKEIGVRALEVMVPAFIYCRITHKVMTYETTGTVTSSIGRSLFGKIRPTK